MRRITELSSCIRGMALGGHQFGKTVEDHTVQGGGGQKLPTALAVLAAAESRFMFFLVKFSGCRENLEENHEDQAGADVSGTGSGDQAG